ncbi:MAG TPA: EAL domain-containing response regulator [Burkholderiales bacterium]|jgi:EAL domain-containing protein (putative c-di-GMP-specific phosphodiesterase class I)/CheY-like chemotaxis protein
MTLARQPQSALIVEDSRLQREFAAALLAELGVETIYQTQNGREAADLLGMLIFRPSLALVDLEMPEMDGIALIQKLHQENLGLPLVLMSSREQSLLAAVEQMAQELGLQVLAAVQKPLTREALQRALEHYTPFENGAAPAPREPAPAIGAQDLRQALAQGGIITHYQPKVDIRTGVVNGVEALARWQHAELGRIAPDRFIPLAEKEGLIFDLTTQVLEAALRQAAQWNRRGLKLTVAVNLSPCLLDRAELVDEICAVVARHQLLPSQLVLEITESALASDIGRALGILARLRLKGFRLSIDDYGTGYSSMQQLARIPFNELKIDRSFVHGAHGKRNYMLLLASTIDLATRLGLATVAEGVETEEDWRVLRELGCTTAQGYFLAAPMPAENFIAWKRKYREQLAPQLRDQEAASGPRRGAALLAG